MRSLSLGIFRSLRRNHCLTRRQFLLVVFLSFLLSFQPYSINNYFNQMRWEANIRSHYHVYGHKISPLEREELPSSLLSQGQPVVNFSSYVIKIGRIKGWRRGQLNHEGNSNRLLFVGAGSPADKERAVSQQRVTGLASLDDVTTRNNAQKRKRRKKQKELVGLSEMQVTDTETKVKDMKVTGTKVVTTVQVVGGDTTISPEKLSMTFEPDGKGQS